MNRAYSPFTDRLLFANPPDIWESLDDATRQQVIERLARLLLEAWRQEAGRIITSHQSNQKGRAL